MFRGHPGRWSAARQAAFVLLPVVMGAGVLIAGGDGPAPAISRLETTPSSVAPALEPEAVDVGVVEATPAGGAAGAGIEAVAPAVAAPVVDVAAPAPAAGPAATGTGAAGAAAVVAGEVASPASAGTPAAGSPASTVPATTSTSSSTTTTTTTAPPARARKAGAEAEVVPLTNADRAAAGLGALSRNGCLDAVASGYAEQLARSGVLAHNPGAGPAVTGCRANATWGDNVGMSTACDMAVLEREWMASPGHRRNILTGAFTLIGVGAWTDEKGTCWVQVLFSS